MNIELALYRDHVGAIFVNDSTTELRLWGLENSWGWWTVSFQVRGEQNEAISNLLHLWNMEWTKNGPDTFVVAPNEKQEFHINLNHWEWMRDHNLSQLRDKTLQVRVCYSAEPMNTDDLRLFTEYPEDFPEHAKQRKELFVAHLTSVFTGSVMSDWVTSEPPHDWLFGQQAPFPGIETAEQMQKYLPNEVLERVSSLVDYLAWYIELNAKQINQYTVASAIEVDRLPAGMTVGHLTSNILEYALQIQKIASAAREYLKSRS